MEDSKIALVHSPCSCWVRIRGLGRSPRVCLTVVCCVAGMGTAGAAEGSSKRFVKLHNLIARSYGAVVDSQTAADLGLLAAVPRVVQCPTLILSSAVEAGGRQLLVYLDSAPLAAAGM